MLKLARILYTRRKKMLTTPKGFYMNEIDVAQKYFDAWNAHDPTAVIATFTAEGTYSDPSVQGITGEAIGDYVQGLLDMFPDLSFEIKSKGIISSGLVAAEWLMQGSHKDTGGRVALLGADFIQVENNHIRSVQGYFDNTTMQKQLGMEVSVYPAEPQGPFSFGSVTHYQSGKNVRPGAISLTWIDSPTNEDAQHVGDYTQKIVEESTKLPGFLSIMLSSIGRRGYTITTWEDVDQPRQLLREGQHKESMKWFFSKESKATGMTSVWKLHHMRMMMRCQECNEIVDYDADKKTCSCGEPIPEPPPYW